VANYVDVDPTGKASDFRCQLRTYDEHDGVDFAVRDLGVMRTGVPVLASAAGVVTNVRDGMEDVALTDVTSRTRIRGRECGNGILIEHKGGWQTQYCHLRKGSVRVKPGERIEAGRPIGLVGLSGLTEFPHAHLTVRHHGEVVDPFTGQPMKDGCGQGATSLWSDEQKIEYEPAALYNAGFAVGKPDLAAIRNGLRDDGPFPANVPALVLWVDIFGVQAGDRLRFLISGPKGEAILDNEQGVEKAQARRFVFSGKSAPKSGWASGTYTGEVTLIRQRRDYAITDRIVRTVAVR
jgi:hypothetical protein